MASIKMQREITCFKSSVESTYNSDNENIYRPKFAWYAERSSLADINPKSCHLTAFKPVNPLLRCDFRNLAIHRPTTISLWQARFSDGYFYST